MYFNNLPCFGVIIHVIFLISIFDIYFKSPIITGIPPEPNPVVPLTKRVAFISVDGLRVDSLFDLDPSTGKPVAEYVQNIIKNRGSWGVSQSRVPTESRPGHVAMLAGIYEDPSAVTKGWKENPVDFDSLFNRSRCSFAWGSPDILQIFFKGLKHNCAYMNSYESEQNFAGDSRMYDNWVYDKFEEFLKFSKTSLSLHNEGIFFFFHLLGQDTSGHTDKPHTEKYRLNLKNVDRLVEKIENLFYDFYGDDRTSFIFTSDHGMTDWGSHGSGDSEEINTPFIAWGAGIKKPTDPPKQININQADITPLVAVLLGSSIPVNSIGVLPISYLNMSKRQIAECIFLNAKQIISQYLKLVHDTEKNVISWFYIPFKKLLVSDVASKYSLVRNAIKTEKYSEAIFMSKSLIEYGLEGLSYYHNYYQKLLLYCISLSYLGWIVYLLLELFHEQNQQNSPTNPLLHVLFVICVVITVILVSIQKLPLSYYSYILLPEILWYVTIKKVCAMQHILSKIDKGVFLYFAFFLFVAVEVLVISFFHRWCLCISVTVILLWSLSTIKFQAHKWLLCFWLISGCALGFFSLLPVVGGQPNPALVLSSGVCLCSLSFMRYISNKEKGAFSFVLKFFSLIISSWNSFVVHSNFNEQQELLDFNKHISWCLLMLSLGLLVFGQESLLNKLHQIFMSLSIPFLLLTIKHEGFFLLFLFIHLFCWVHIEIHANNHNSTKSLFRITYFFLTYIFISFFGLGNISSLNSFDPAWVRCFLTVFSPFSMSALILLKTVIPFLSVTCTLRIVTAMLNIETKKLFIITLIYCNIMGLNFLFLVRNTGSWLDIGTSISHYVIQQVTIVFLVVLFSFAKVLTKVSGKVKGSPVKEKNVLKLSSNCAKGFSLPTFYSSNKQHKL